MRHCPALLLLLTALSLSASAQQTPEQTPRTESVRTSESRIVHSEDAKLAKAWGLRDDEFAHYRELMAGPLGVYSPNLDPLSALGVEARSEEERQRYAELQVQAEARRVEKLLAYQRAYDAAWQRLHPDLQRVNLPDDSPASANAGSSRTAVFIKEACVTCRRLVQRLQRSGAAFDIYMVGSDQDDARIRAWAHSANIDPARVRSGDITLNHDGGRWLLLGLPGDLPAVATRCRW